MNAQVIAVVNQKGGTGKSTTCANLGIGLAQAGKKVLVVDVDPQASLSISLGHSQPPDLPGHEVAVLLHRSEQLSVALPQTAVNFQQPPFGHTLRCLAVSIRGAAHGRGIQSGYAEGIPDVKLREAFYARGFRLWFAVPVRQSVRHGLFFLPMLMSPGFSSAVLLFVVNMLRYSSSVCSGGMP